MRDRNRQILPRQDKQTPACSLLNTQLFFGDPMTNTTEHETAARNAIPELLAEVEALRKERDYLELISVDLTTTLAQSLRERAEKAEATNGPTGICETCQSHTVKQADEANARALKVEADRKSGDAKYAIFKAVCSAELATLRARLARLESALREIVNGECDEFVANGGSEIEWAREVADDVLRGEC
jgi:hypothetical protein